VPRRVCLVYDCLYPFTVGGAERWYRNVAERLATEGHEVTYLTLRQWPRGEDPGVRGVRVVAVAPRMDLYVRGRRRILPPLAFGAGVFLHLLRHGRRYDVVHTASFPYFPLLAAGALRRLGRYRLLVDWIEVWTREYWEEYLGRIGGSVGWLVQRLSVRISERAFCYSQLHVRRLREEGFRGELSMLAGLYVGPVNTPRREAVDPLVVFAGRHIPEKRVPALVPALARARERLPALCGEIYGDGPERDQVLSAIGALGLDGAVRAPGFVDADAIDAALERALCLVLPSRREGFGMIVIEAAARGTPSVVVSDPDNAASELVEDGVNGVLAASASAEDLAAAILRVHEAGDELRQSTAAWFERNAERLSLSSALETLASTYA
jgi:glycosyltransferase involved in cell wall biosynthesis